MSANAWTDLLLSEGWTPCDEAPYWQHADGRRLRRIEAIKEIMHAEMGHGHAGSQLDPKRTNKLPYPKSSRKPSLDELDRR